MKLAFMGTPVFAMAVLEELDKEFNIVWVLSQPAKKQGRGKKLQSSAVVEYAKQKNIKYFEASRITRELNNELESLEKPDLIIVVAYGVIIPEWFIEKQSVRPLNIHYSLLPRYRGAAPVARAIMAGEQFTGVSIMQIVKELDAGDIVASKKLKIEDDDTTETLTWKLTKVGIELLKTTIIPYVYGELRTLKQDHTCVSYAKKLSKEEARIDWNQDARTIFNKVRALNPWPIAYTTYKETNIKILKVLVEEDSRYTNYRTGQIVEVSKKALKVQSNNGLLSILELKPENKAVQNFKDFINGYRVKEGEFFF